MDVYGEVDRIQLWAGKQELRALGSGLDGLRCCCQIGQPVGALTHVRQCRGHVEHVHQVADVLACGCASAYGFDGAVIFDAQDGHLLPGSGDRLEASDDEANRVKHHRARAIAAALSHGFTPMPCAASMARAYARANS